MKIELLVSVLVLLLSSGMALGQGDLFSSNYLDGGSGGTAADYIADPDSGFMNFEDYLNSISIDNYLDGLEDGDGDGEGTSPVDDGGPTSGDPEDIPDDIGPGGSNPNEENLDLIGETPGEVDRPYREGLNNETELSHLDPYYWRSWRDPHERERVQQIHRQRYQSPNPIGIEGSPWSYTYWPMSDCGLAFARMTAIDPAKLRNSRDRANEVYKLSPMEVFDTYCYNKYGEIPCAAAYEAHPHKHNTKVWSQRRVEENSDEIAHFWIVREQLHRMGSCPFDFRLRDGRGPQERRSQDGNQVNYHMQTDGRSYRVPARLTMSERTYFPNTVVEEFYVPFEAANSVADMGIQDLDTKFQIIMLDENGNHQTYQDEQGNTVARTRELTWNEIQADPSLARRHKRARDPEYIRVFRTVEMREVNGRVAADLSKTINWYCLQYHIKPGSLHHGWWGHCNGWSAASIRVPLPEAFPIRKSFNGKKIKIVRLKLDRAVDAMSADGEPQVSISEDDYEIIETDATNLYVQPSHYFGIATELWNDCDTNIMNRPDAFYTSLDTGDALGHRYDGSMGNEDLANEYLQDIYPNHFFSLLMHHVKEKREGLVCDINKGSQVWNQPVRAFTYGHQFRPTPEDEVSEGFYLLDLRIDYVPYGGLWRERNPERYQIGQPIQRWNRYLAKLYIDKATHRIYRGEWARGGGVDSVDSHPDFCWIPIDPVASRQRDQNENLSDRRAQEFLELD